MIISGMANQLRHRFLSSVSQHSASLPAHLRSGLLRFSPVDVSRRERLPTGAQDVDPPDEGLQLNDTKLLSTLRSTPLNLESFR